MAIVHGLAFKVYAGPSAAEATRLRGMPHWGWTGCCHGPVRALGECDRPPITTLAGLWHLRRAPAGCSCSAPHHDHGREQAWTWM
jgi:hypothetical protein